MDRSPTTCARHPEVTTRLRCVGCSTAICPDCGREAAVGFKCPDCAAPDAATTGGRVSGRGGFAGLTSRASSRPAPSRNGPVAGSVVLRALAAAIGAAGLGGLVLGPVLQGGFFFLLGSGVVGWGVARAVYWATGEANSSAIQAIALVASGASVAVGIGVAATLVGGMGPSLAVLAYPAALYGGWIVVRQR